MPVVTMSGNIASGAREVGEAAARALGIDFVDQQLLVEAARRCGVPVGAMAQRDERCEGFRERLASLLRSFLERSVASGADPLTGAIGLEALLSRTYAEMAAEHEEPELTDALYMKTMTVIIQELGARGDIVILGRGSQMILKDLPGAVHVLCTAPQKFRAHRLAERDGLGIEEAARQVADKDRAQAAYYRKFWKVEFEDPRLYDLTVDTSRLSYEIAADLVAAAARAKSSVPASP